MELSTKLLFIAVFVIIMIIMGTNHKKKKKKIIFLGDSITEFGSRPGGFIALISEFLRTDGIDEKVEIINAGKGGNKVYDLYIRLEPDVLIKEPHLVILFIGVNDIWHKQKHGTGTDINNFKKFYEALVTKIMAARAKLVVCTPAIIGESSEVHKEDWRELKLYGDAIKNIAAENNVPVVDLHKVFVQHYVESNLYNADEGIFTIDGVHLNVAGNNLVAEEIWKILRHLL